MSEKLQVGDVAILLIHPDAHPDLVKYQGGEVVLVAYHVIVNAWEVRAPDGFEFCAKERVLRKRRGPRDDLQLVRWSECPWQPEQVRA
jgi:hypothetical protein